MRGVKVDATDQVRIAAEHEMKTPMPLGLLRYRVQVRGKNGRWKNVRGLPFLTWEEARRWFEHIRG